MMGGGSWCGNGRAFLRSDGGDMMGLEGDADMKGWV